MLRKWIYKWLPYFITANLCTLTPVGMLIYCQLGNVSLYGEILRLSLFLILGLPLMLFALTWCIDVALRFFLKYLFHPRHYGSSLSFYRELLRLPSVPAMRACFIIQIMYSCIMIGITIMPVLRRMYL